MDIHEGGEVSTCNFTIDKITKSIYVLQTSNHSCKNATKIYNYSKIYDFVFMSR